MHDTNPELFNLAMSPEAQPLLDAVKKHIADNVDPITDEFYTLQKEKEDPWVWHPRQLELLEGAKQKARDAGLWNFFLPSSEIGKGLTNLDYAYIAAELGKSPLSSQTLNCSAPDTGNMEVLERVGTPEQQETWLKPLLEGEIRSAYAMTEPHVASSDASNIETSAVLDGDEWVINGEMYYISGAGDPRLNIMIFMVTSPRPNLPPAVQILVPMDTPGVNILGPPMVYGDPHAPHGHMHIEFNNVRVPKDNVLLGEGRGLFAAWLGPGEFITACAQVDGQVALELMVNVVLADSVQNRY